MKGHVRKRGNRWYFALWIPNPITGKKEQKWFSSWKTEPEAKKAMARKILEIDQGSYIEPARIPLKDYLIRWYKDYVELNCAATTRQGYKSILKNHLIPELGHIKLGKLKPIQIQSYYTQKSKKGRKDGRKGGLSHRSILHHHRVLYEALEQAVKWQLLSANPAKSTTPPKPARAQFNVLTTKEEIYTLLDTVDRKGLYDPVYFAICTGLRRGELFALRWADVDMKNNIISIQQTLILLDGNILEFKDGAKNDGSRRTVAVTDSIINGLKRRKIEQEQHKAYYGPLYKDHDLIFSNKDGSPINIGSFSKTFGRTVKKADIPYVRFHDLRHSHATLLLQQGEHPKIVSERLGHSSIGITMDTYSHVLPNMQKEAAQKLDDFLTR
ncbi:integrase [Croceifilum oryzae]|uniref:Integrase n=1 Tax=Croceifilum oryzae TaxID=1553429 RepID=A0AAJ1TFB3_9BACL|nr:tyrosine-type recombinase/integrase [Croceifilum oryzae]MDQ0417890.1 integrase [Croceifilum oryzae]